MADLTGRDAFLIREALATAIVALEAVPKERRPSSNIEDMKTLLSAVTDSTMMAFLLAQTKIRLRPDLRPFAIYREYGFDEIADGLEKLARDNGEL